MNLFEPFDASNDSLGLVFPSLLIIMLKLGTVRTSKSQGHMSN
jgi:hypothetical protein